MFTQVEKEKFEEQLQAMRMLQIKVRRKPQDNASWKKLREGDAVLQSLFENAYPSVEDYIEKLFEPVNKQAEEWGIEPRRASTVASYREHSRSNFELLNSIKNHASECLSLDRENTRDISLKKRYLPSNIQPVIATDVRSMMLDHFHSETPNGDYGIPLRITDLDYGSVEIGGYGTKNIARFVKVSGVDIEGTHQSFVLSQNDLEHRSLDQSPQKAKKLEVGDMIAVNTRSASRDDFHQYIDGMRGLPQVQSLFLVTPSAFFEDAENGKVVIDGRIEEYGKIVLKGDWPTRQVTIKDAFGKKGTFTLPGNADYDRPVAKEGERVVGVASRDGRLSALRPL